jgi:hypothetical protein
MTSISSVSAGTHQSPLQRLQQELQSEVSAGTVSSSDESALSTALNDSDSAIQQSRSSDDSSGTKSSRGTSNRRSTTSSPMRSRTARSPPTRPPS